MYVLVIILSCKNVRVQDNISDNKDKEVNALNIVCIPFHQLYFNSFSTW